MSSSVYFKFKSQKEPSRITFDGNGISVFELKRDIIIQSGLGDGTEFDLKIFSEDLSEEYDDDTTIIPRATLVIARRMPPQKPGAGRAARYMTGKAPVNAKNSRRAEQTTSAAKPKPATTINAAMTEEEKMAAMFAQQNEQWNATQMEMANQTPVFNNNSKPGQKKMPQNVPDHEPPSGYICYRCGEKGHWIQVCPTNEDPTFDNKPRVKRTTGIPRSFLKTVEKPTNHVNDGTMDDTKAQAVMVNAEGEFVVAEPDSRAWEKFQEQNKTVAAQQKASDSSDQEWKDRGLECPIDKRLFVDPFKTPCCETTYCYDCISNALIESDFTCPGCGKDEIFIDNLIADAEVAEKLNQYQKDLMERKKASSEKARSESPAATPPVKSTTPLPSTSINSPSVSIEASSNTVTEPINDQVSLAKGKKRPAEDDTPDEANAPAPKAPRAMQGSQTASAPSNDSNLAAAGGFEMPVWGAPNGIMPGMPGPNMNGMMANNFYGGMGMPNPFGGMGMPNFYGGMGMGMPNMAPYGNVMPVMNGAWPNFGMAQPMFGQFDNQQGMWPNGQMNGGYMNGGHGGGMNNRGGFHHGHMNQQQRTTTLNGVAKGPAGPYERTPVNPHRSQGRVNKNPRQSDVREVVTPADGVN